MGKVLVSGSQREQASRDVEGFQSSTICLMLPHPLLPASSPHAALSSSSKQGLRRFPLWPQKPLCVGSLPSSESSSQIHKKYCWNNTLPWITPYKLLLSSPTALTARREMLMPRGCSLNCMASVQWKHIYKLAAIAGVHSGSAAREDLRWY